MGLCSASGLVPRVTDSRMLGNWLTFPVSLPTCTMDTVRSIL